MHTDDWEAFEQWDLVQQQLIQAGLSDGLPLIPPSRARVQRMLASSPAAPHDVVAILPPLYVEATWHDLAVNAVMAGCEPEYLPVIAAIVQAMAEPEFNLLGITTTTGSAAPLIVVNGPVARRIGMNGGANALGPGNRANATIGRAVSLILRNVAGALPEQMDMSTLGQPSKYTCCFAENETGSAWSTLHQDRGFLLEDSVVTVFGISGTIEIVDKDSRTGEDLAQTFAQSMLIAGTCGNSTFIAGGEPLLVVPPEIVQLYTTTGFSKAQAKAEIFARARLPRDRLSRGVREHLRRLGDSESESDLQIAAKAEDLTFVVAGGVGVKSMYAPTSSWATRSVSKKVIET